MILPEAPLLLSQPASVSGPGADESAQVPGIALIPVSKCLEIVLPRSPAGRLDLTSMLAEHAPVLPRHLAWTCPVATASGTARITLVRRDWLDGYIGELERERGCRVEARTERDGRLFQYASPATRRARYITLGVWIVSLAISAGMLIAMPALGGPLEAPTKTQVDNVAANPAFLRAGVSQTLAGQPLAGLPTGWLNVVAVKRDGSLTVELQAPDPDLLRDTVVEQSLLPDYRELSQRRDQAGNYRVTYGLDQGSLPVAMSRGAPQIAVLSARDSDHAIAQAEQALIAYIAKQGLQLGMISSAPERTGSVELTIELVGPQDKVLAVVQMIETGRPPARFVEWELTPDRAGTRLAAILTVPWAKLN